MSEARALAKPGAGSRRRPPVRVNYVSIDRLSLDLSVVIGGAYL